MEYTDVLISIRKIIRAINLESKRIEKEYGISIPQLLCLDYLNKKFNFQATSTELKKFLQLNASTVTGIIARLEKKGLVAKLPKSPKDKRVTHITITSKGAELLERKPLLMHEQLSTKLKDMPTKELDQLRQSIDLLVEFMGVSKVEASPVITSEEDIAAQE